MADMRHSKCRVRKGVWVRVPPRPINSSSRSVRLAAGSLGGVRLDLGELGRRQPAGLAQDALVNADLAEVVERRADLQAVVLGGTDLHLLAEQQGVRGNALGVAGAVRVAGIDRLGE